MSELNKIALKILEKGKGILSADESTGTMSKRLDSVNVSSTTENRLLSNIESYDFPLWKVNGIVIS